MTIKVKSNKVLLQKEYENKFVKMKLEGFDPYKSEAWKKLTTRYGTKISHSQLLSIAEVISFHLQIQLYREYKRRKEMLIKWFDEQISLVFPFIDNHLIIIDDKGHVY